MREKLDVETAGASSVEAASSDAAFPFKYRAFLSYSHHDLEVARRLHVALERYRIPRSLVGTSARDGVVPATLFPIFRDRDELAAASSLSQTLRLALEGSANLIVLCSPASARSRYVEAEILTFKRLGRAERIHALVIDGDPLASPGADGHCFPAALLSVLDEDGDVMPEIRAEPLAADLRSEGDGRGDAQLKIIAGLLGIPFNALRQRERIAARRRRRWQVSLAGAIMILFVGGGLATRYAYFFREEADERQMAGIRMVDHLSTLDLTGWQPTTVADIEHHVKRSLAVGTDSYTLIKTQSLAENFVHIIGTTSDIPPQIECGGCTIVDRRPDGASRTAHEYRLSFNIAKVGLEQSVPISYVTRYWNAFQEPSQWWSGVRISDLTESFRFDVIFPAGKHPLASTLHYYYFDIKEHPLSTEPDVTLTPDDGDSTRVSRLSWRVSFPLTDRSYRIRWDWNK